MPPYVAEFVSDNPQPNIPWLRKLWDWVQEQNALRKAGKPSEWLQTSWVVRSLDGIAAVAPGYCGTACCIAGKYALETLDIPFEAFGVECVHIDGRCVSYRSYAAKGLGLTQSEASRLFDGCTRVEDVKRVLTGVFERAGEKL